jgi:hypothetical protein
MSRQVNVNLTQLREQRAPRRFWTNRSYLAYYSREYVDARTRTLPRQNGKKKVLSKVTLGCCKLQWLGNRILRQESFKSHQGCDSRSAPSLVNQHSHAV